MAASDRDLGGLAASNLTDSCAGVRILATISNPIPTIPSMARPDSVGDWCSPTREVAGSQLIRLVEESRQEEAAVAMIHDEPTRKCPAATLELLERSRFDTSLEIPIEDVQFAEGTNPKL